MILTSFIIISLALVAAIFGVHAELAEYKKFTLWRERRAAKEKNDYCQTVLYYFDNENKKIKNEIFGRMEKVERSAAIAEKFAEQAFRIGSSSSLGVVALQKALTIPRVLTKTQVTQNKLAKKQIDELYDVNGKFDFLKPILDDAELEIIENIEEAERKAKTS